MGMLWVALRRACVLLTLPALLPSASAQGPESVLVVVNDASALSRSIGEYYALRRAVPLANVCHVKTTTDEEIARGVYNIIAATVANCLRSRSLSEKVLYIATTAGVPLRIAGMPGGNDGASVDSELAMLYTDMRRGAHPLGGPLGNPFYRHAKENFSHARFPIYLVTRLAGYDFADVKAIIDRSLQAKNRGKFVLDLKSWLGGEGNDWLREAARRLPKNRVVLDESDRVLLNQTDVIGYAAWGSNDPHRSQRHLGFHWLPGAIATEFVSTDGRTFVRPPDTWTLGNWSDSKTYFGRSPQSLTADYIHDGATGASGHVAEPFLQFTPRPEILLPAYYSGRNLAESFYLAMPAVSWQNIVVGDPLCSLGKP